MVKRFELMLRGGDVVVWEGATWEEAAWSYAKNHPGKAVVAWRPARGPSLAVGIGTIIEPGDPGW